MYFESQRRGRIKFETGREGERWRSLPILICVETRTREMLKLEGINERIRRQTANEVFATDFYFYVGFGIEQMTSTSQLGSKKKLKVNHISNYGKACQKKKTLLTEIKQQIQFVTDIGLSVFAATRNPILIIIQTIIRLPHIF